MKFTIQSFGDIITNSSTETFCISNGSTSDLQLFINTILKTHGVNDSQIIIKETVDYDSITDLSENSLDLLAEMVYSNWDINHETFLNLVYQQKWDKLEDLCLKAYTNLVDIARMFNSGQYYGLILIRYTAETTLPDADILKEQVENLSGLFTYGEYKY